MKKFKHALIAMKKEDVLSGVVTSDSILHFTGYWKKPRDIEYIRLYNELATDEDHGLVGVDVAIIPAPKELIKEYFKEMQITESL